MTDITTTAVKKQTLYNAAILILQHTPHMLIKFKALWEQGNCRAIFDFLDGLSRKKEVMVNADFEKALTDYFWLFCH